MVHLIENVFGVVTTAGSETFNFGKTIVHSGYWAVSNIVSSIIHI